MGSYNVGRLFEQASLPCFSARALGWGLLKDCSLNDQSCFTLFPMLSFTWKKLRGVGSKNVYTI